MQPLTGVRHSDGEGIGVAQGAGRRLVLPRILRRPARLIARRQWRLPRAAGTKGVVALFVATALTGVIAGGHATTVVSAVTAWSGLGIQAIEISGQSDASEVDILESLDVGPFPSLLTFDLEAARTRVEALPWIEIARLTKLFPNTLQVAVSERKPDALWQRDGEIMLIDANGRAIAAARGDRYGTLPYVVGQGAEARLDEYKALIASVPMIAERVRAGVLVSGRRWTLILRSGIEILLPREKPEAALAAIARLDADSALLSREIAAVDFRFADKAILRLTERGIEERNDLLKQRARDAKRRRSGA
ncbi:MAG: cell division protein FtsQ/DivIB [Alphaproteobacteria bacterium]